MPQQAWVLASRRVLILFTFSLLALFLILTRIPSRLSLSRNTHSISNKIYDLHIEKAGDADDFQKSDDSPGLDPIEPSGNPDLAVDDMYVS